MRNMASSAEPSSVPEVLSTRKGKICLVVDNYQHRLHRKNKENLSWVCVNDKKSKCKGNVKTDFQHKVIKKVDHTCVPNVAQIEIKKVMENCRKRIREEIAVPVHKIFKEEISTIYEKGYDLVANTPQYANAKTLLCRERRRVLGTEQNPKNDMDISFSGEILRLTNNDSFLRLDFLSNEGKRILVFGGQDTEDMLKQGEDFFFDGTFKSCSKQFSQLYTIHVDCGSSDLETNIYPAIFALLPDKKEETYCALFRELKGWCSSWCPSKIKVDFEPAVINAAKKVFPNAMISGCNFHYNQCLWRKIQEIGLATGYKDDEEIRKVCRMCSALAFLPLNTIDDAWLIIMGKAPENEKLKKFLDYFVNQWLDNANNPIEMWNINNQRHRTNNAVEGWNAKLNKIIGIKEPNIYLLVKTLKDEATRVSHSLKAKELGHNGIKRRKTYIQLDERIKNIMREFENSKNLEKCMTALSYVTKMD